MEKLGKIISFGNQKGGSGKTTTSIMFANFIHNNTNLKILYVDSDDMQRSFEVLRLKDLKYFDVKESDPYDYATINAKDLPLLLQDLPDEYDIILLDLAGSMKQEGNMETYFYIDYIFTPLVVHSPLEVDSSFEYRRTFYEKIIPFRTKEGLDTNFYFFLNKATTNLVSYKDFKENIPELENQGVNFIKSEIGDFKSVLCDGLNTINTLNPAKTDKFDVFCIEVLEKMNINFSEVKKDQTIWKVRKEEIEN